MKKYKFYYLAALSLIVFMGAKIDLHKNILKTIHQIKAKNKTQDVTTTGDSADDTAIYINEEDPKKSLIIGTNKQAGLIVYDLDGKITQEFPDGELNNVDIRYGFEFNDKEVALIAASNRTFDTIDFYYVDDTQKVSRLSSNEHAAGLKIYGLCMYKDKENNQYYVFVNSKKGEVIQWLIEEKDENLALSKAREFKLSSQVEGCVADDDYNKFYISEETKGIWQYEAFSESIKEPILIDSVSLNGNLVADVEGLAIYHAGKKEGYLIASSQGENAFAIYSRKTLEYIGKFQVNYKDKQIQNTDGISIASHSLDLSYPFGIIVVQDGNQTNDFQNFKMVSWLSLATSFFPPLRLETKDIITE